MNISIKQSPTDLDIEKVLEKLRDFNTPFLENSNDEKVMFYLTSANDTVEAGLVARIRGIWLEINYLMVQESLRGQGVGKKLVNKAEAFAIQQGCRFAFLHTFSFQARPFYEKLGYTVKFTQHDYPDVGYQQFYLTKKL